MRFNSTVVWMVIVAGVCTSGTIGTAQESRRDAIYSQFEEYNAATPTDKIQARLDALAEHVKLNPSLTVVLFSYGGRQSCREEALLRGRLAMSYLSSVHGISSNRVKIRNGGYRNYWAVELWVGSIDATPPRAAKTINKRRVTTKGKCQLVPISSSP